MLSFEESEASEGCSSVAVCSQLETSQRVLELALGSLTRTNDPPSSLRSHSSNPPAPPPHLSSRTAHPHPHTRSAMSATDSPSSPPAPTPSNLPPQAAAAAHSAVSTASKDEGDLTVLSSPTDFTVKHPLYSPWTLWFDSASKQDKSKSWEEALTKVISFHSVEEFWGSVRTLFPLDQLRWNEGRKRSLMLRSFPVQPLQQHRPALDARRQQQLLPLQAGHQAGVGRRGQRARRQVERSAPARQVHGPDRHLLAVYGACRFSASSLPVCPVCRASD